MIRLVWTAILAAVLLGGGWLAFATEFRQALPGYQYVFPRDHASHEAFKTEWWYYTGHLKTADNRRYGFELTFFRVGNDREQLPDNPPWALKNLYMTHFAVSDRNARSFFHDQKLNRAAYGFAGANSDRYHAWNGNWSVELVDGVHHLKAQTADYAIDLTLTPKKPPVLHGKGGVSQKAACEGCASHYYSLTRLETAGTITSQGRTTPVTGLSWMDHEFGSNQLTEEQTGWDWFSLQLDDDTEVMLYLLRRKDGTPEPNSSGTVIYADGSSRHLPLDAFTVTPTGAWTSPESGGVYPMGWTIAIPSEKLHLTVTPAFENQELHSPFLSGITYWEGASDITGTRGTSRVKGRAYVEMTGYAQDFDEDI